MLQARETSQTVIGMETNGGAPDVTETTNAADYAASAVCATIAANVAQGGKGGQA